MLASTESSGGYSALVSSFVWIRSWVTILSSIAPLCIAYCALLFVLPSWLRFPIYFECWILAETLFYGFTISYRLLYLERPTSHPPPLSAEDRQKLFDLCQKTTKSPDRYISKWFHGAPVKNIKRENIKEFFRWAFFNLAIDDPTYDEEVERLVKAFELTSDLRFAPGRGDVECIRLTVDGVNALHRSLTWYSAIAVVDMLTHAYMLFNGFLYYRASGRHCTRVFPPRPWALTTFHKSPVSELGYWYLPHTATKELPILFLHGIGVGLYPYMEFLAELNKSRSKADGRIGIIAVELLAISSRLTSPFPSSPELCRAVRKILQHHDIGDFVLMSHSYGSIIATNLLKTPDIARQISSVILVDPITFLLHEPDVAYNFTVRHPQSAQEWLLYYFGSKDISTAHTLARHFFWYENILWKGDLRGRRATVFLSENDAIVNAPLVRDYLQGGEDGIEDVKGQVDVGVEWCEGQHHGQIFNTRASRQRLMRETLLQVRKENGKELVINGK